MDCQKVVQTVEAVAGNGSNEGNSLENRSEVIEKTKDARVCYPREVEPPMQEEFRGMMTSGAGFILELRK